MGSDFAVTIFRVEESERTRLDVDGKVLGRGVQFPSGSCVIEWNREAFPPGERLDTPHTSVYGTLSDVEQATGGDVHRERIVPGE